MDNETARKYGDFKALSSGQAPAHWNYRTRLDSIPFLASGNKSRNGLRRNRECKPQDCKVYSSDDALLLAIKNRHDGPWSDLE
jgi:hypothetical protein